MTEHELKYYSHTDIQLLSGDSLFIISLTWLMQIIRHKPVISMIWTVLYQLPTAPEITFGDFPKL